jgi:hypothetical protein
MTHTSELGPLCTSCNRLIRPVIAIDIDGTLANYHYHFFKFAEKYFNRTFNEGYDGSVKLFEWMKITQEEYRQCKLSYRLGGMKRSIPTYLPNTTTSRQVHSLRNKGAEIWFTTTRPYLRLDNTDPDTREWIYRNELEPYDGLIYDEDKYGMLLDIVGPNRIIGVVDDDPVQYDRAEELELSPIQIARQHNLSCRRTVIAGNLVSAVKMLNIRIDKWMGKYERTYFDGR